MARGRVLRIEKRERFQGWVKPPVQIEPKTCIGCDACIRHCPTGLGAVFRRGFKELFILPELCSGCGLCVKACPVESIHAAPDWQPSPEADWLQPGGHDDPYLPAATAKEP